MHMQMHMHIEGVASLGWTPSEDCILTWGAGRVPTLFHCGDEPISTPLSIAQAAAACPDAVIILGPMGGYFHVDEANVHVHTTGTYREDFLERVVVTFGPERLVFATAARLFTMA